MRRAVHPRRRPTAQGPMSRVCKKKLDQEHTLDTAVGDCQLRGTEAPSADLTGSQDRCAAFWELRTDKHSLAVS